MAGATLLLGAATWNLFFVGSESDLKQYERDGEAEEGAQKTIRSKATRARKETRSKRKKSESSIGHYIPAAGQWRNPFTDAPSQRGSDSFWRALAADPPPKSFTLGGLLGGAETLLS